MKKSSIKSLLFSGAGYFLLVSVAHAFGWKIPGLFIYFNVPSYTYQNQIIAAMVFGWAVFLLTAGAALSKELIRAVIISGAAAIIMLTIINFNTNFNSFSDKINVNVFHLETGMLFMYWVFLVMFYNKFRLSSQGN